MESRRLALIAVAFLVVAVVVAALVNARLQPTGPPATIPVPAAVPAAGTATVTSAPGSVAIVPPVVDAMRVTASGDAVLAGTAEAGAKVDILDGPTVIGSADTNARGAFAVALDKPSRPATTGSGPLHRQGRRYPAFLRAWR
jgi:hypothetical protein